MSPWPISANDLIAAAGSAGLLIAYHVFLHHKNARDSAYSVQGANERTRTLWVQTVMQQHKDILGVQTLRNSTMAATFLASTAVVLVMGILNLIAKGDALSSKSGPKLLMILLDLFVAFFCFAMSIRLYHHVGYMIGTPIDVEGAPGPLQVARQLNRATTFYGAGMRAFYCLVPLVFWFFGAWALLGATLGLILLLFSNDRAPRAPADG